MNKRSPLFYTILVAVLCNACTSNRDKNKEHTDAQNKALSDYAQKRDSIYNAYQNDEKAHNAAFWHAYDSIKASIKKPGEQRAAFTELTKEYMTYTNNAQNKRDNELKAAWAELDSIYNAHEAQKTR